MNYLQSLADEIRNALPDDLVPDRGSDQLFVLYALLAHIKGDETDLRDVHDAWAAWKILMDHSEHPAIVPFDQLPLETKRQDQPFVDAIQRATRRRAKPTPSRAEPPVSTRKHRTPPSRPLRTGGTVPRSSAGY